MQFSLCRLRSHQWCFLLFNMLLFHAMLFGADFVEEYLLQPTPGVYTDRAVLDVRERARKLDLSPSRNVSQALYPIANAHACLNSDLFLLTLVFSSAANATQRDAVRSSWGNQTQVRGGFPVRTLFFLAGSAPQTSSTSGGAQQQQQQQQQEALLRESERHGDVVQGHDSSSPSSPLRGGRGAEGTLLALRWVITFCPAARFVLLTEDTVFVNLPALGGYLLGLHRHPEDLYLGRVIHRDAPDREPSSPGYLSPGLYPDKYLPDYCAGAACVLSQDVVRKVYVASAGLVRAAVPPDVLVGLCARRAGVTPTHSARFSGWKHVRYNACCYRYLFSSAGMGRAELGAVWADLGGGEEGGGCSLLETYYGLVTCKSLTYLDKLSFFSSQGQAESDSRG